MGKRLIKSIRSTKVKQKIMSIILLGMAIMLFSSVLLVAVMDRAYKKLLHQAMSGSLSYSSKEISDYLNQLEDLSMLLLSDSVIQENLSTIYSTDNQSKIADSIQRIRSSIGGYYQSYSDGILRYITIYSGKATACTNILRADKTTPEIQKAMIQTAEEYEGAPVWITEYTQEDGLFLVRRVNEISSIRSKSIGTILVKLDMDALIHKIVSDGSQYGEMAYMIFREGNPVYITENITLENETIIRELQSDSYKLIRLDGKDFFVLGGKISNYGWDYYCLTSYEEIRREIRRMYLICVAILSLGILVIELLTGRLVGSLTVHVNRMLEKMQQFAKDNTKVPVTDYDYSGRQDELGILHTHFDSMAAKTVDLIQKNYINEILKQEAQYKALESQINPHFLYNTLDSIRWRAKAAGEQEIAKMVEALAVLLRTSLRKNKDAEFTIRDEMEIIEAYIMIQKIRYEERLHFENLISPEYYSRIIPKLTIQPLVENAITYGLESNIDACEILVSAEVSDDRFFIFVKNSDSEIEEDLLEKLESGEIIAHGHGIGLMNIDKRIKIMYGEAYGLSLYNEQEFAVVRLTFPLLAEKE